MKLLISASAIVLALSIGGAFAVEQPQGQAGNPPAPAAAPQKSRQEVAHEKTIAAAARAHDTGVAATAALCTTDKALQTRTQAAAVAAQKTLDAAAQEEAQLDPGVAKAQIAAIQAGLAENGIHTKEEGDKLAADTNAKWDEYGKLKDAKAKEIAEAALQVVSSPTPASTACPPPAPPQRNAEAPPPIPPLPATPAKSISMLMNFNDQLFKATLAQPGLRGRVETLLGLEGCDFSVNAAVSRQATARRAGAYLNRMDDDDLRDTLLNGAMFDRINAAFRRGPCYATSPDNNPVTQFPPPNTQNQNDGPYPYGYPGGYGPGLNPYGAPQMPVPGIPYGGYGPGSIP
jgi:hypothetical protein